MGSEAIGASIKSQQLAHQYKLDQYTDGELIKINKMLNSVESEILHSWDKMTDFSQSRAITLLEETRGLTAGVKGTVSTSVANMAGKVSAESAAVHSKILSFGGKAANVTEVMLQEPVMTAFWKTTPVGGKLLNDWVGRTFDGPMIDKIQHEVATGLFKGESYRELGNRLKEGFGMTKNEIDTLTRTYVQSANVEAMMRTYRENKELIGSLDWSAAKLLSTCLICLSLDGMTFKIEEVPPCPAHPRCRCTLIPNTSMMLLGLKGEDGAKLQAILNEKPKDLRDDAKTWLMSRSEKERKFVLGPKRFDLIESGAVKFTDLVNMDTLKIRTLKELSGDVDLFIKAKAGDAEASALLQAKEEAEKFKLMLADEEEARVINNLIESGKEVEVPLTPRERILLLGSSLELDAAKQMLNELKSEFDDVGEELKKAMSKFSDPYIGMKDEGIKALNEKSRAVGYKVYEKSQEIRAINKGLEEQRVNSITIDPSQRSTAPLARGQLSSLGKKYKEAESYIRSIINKDRVPDVYVRISGQKREFYSNGTIEISTKTNISTIVHEMVHDLEEKNPWILQETRSFLYKRSGGLSPVKLSTLDHSRTYRANELAYEDKWKKLGSPDYAGKVYPDATEILTVGIERLMKDPLDFAKRDPEYFDFLIHIFQGKRP